MSSTRGGLRRTTARVVAGDRAADGAASSALTDTAHVVWPAASYVEVTRSTRPPESASDWLVLPHVGAPRWLLPARAPQTARALVGQETTAPRRAAARALAAAHRAGIVHRLPVRRLRVGEPDGGSLVTALQELAGAEVDVAIRLGSWAHARSVVVRLLRADGTTHAFGKVGIDDVGRAAVRSEAEALDLVAGFDLPRIRHSDIVGRSSWRGLEVLLVSPLLPGARAGDDAMPVAAMRELAGARGSRIAPLGESSWRSRLRRSAGGLRDVDLREELLSHLRRLEQAATGTGVPLGPWHGDWTPWNMARDGSRVLLWDWEHFGEDVPVGFDHIHYLAQQLRTSRGTGPAVETFWLAQAHDVLGSEVGLSRVAQDLVIAAYLLEVNLRFVLDRQGTRQAHDARAGWGLELLRRRVRVLDDPPA